VAIALVPEQHQLGPLGPLMLLLLVPQMTASLQVAVPLLAAEPPLPLQVWLAVMLSPAWVTIKQRAAKAPLLLFSWWVVTAALLSLDMLVLLKLAAALQAVADLGPSQSVRALLQQAPAKAPLLVQLFRAMV